jgi:hypothetical protein
MNTMRRITIVALVMALVAIPTAAFALDDAATDTEPVVTDRPIRDAVTDHLERDFSRIKERALQTIKNQLEVLGRLRAAIGDSRHITGGHAGQLLGDIGRATGGLESLAGKIEAAKTLEELRELIEQIGDFKIKQVLAPKTHQVIASDSLVHATGKLERYSEKLDNVIARFEEAGYDVDEAWRLLDEMNDQISESYRLASPVAENVIGLQASDWPDPAEGILAAGRADLGAAGKNLKSAHRNGVAIVKFLRSLTDGTDPALGGSDVATTDQASDA